MKYIYIIDEFISSQKNGIGTFLRELLFCIVNDVNNINIISFNAEQEEFEIVEEKGIRKFFFPMFGNGNFMEHHKITEKFFKLYIQDSYDNIFFINHSPCASFIESLKNTLPKSKIVFTIHDFGWTGLMFGDLEKYKNEINQYKSNKSKANNSNAVKVYNQEKRIYQLSDKIGDINNTQAYHLNLTTAIIELLDSPELCNTLGKTARRTYVENYQISFMRQKYNELIDKL